ncbi:drug:h+ antiporter [Laetiporus sulphureus 93-53]|uniref:Drug:h+ antiporter n=1 Tax=Laetiporus sulphureus 93-53 TaxID=1314785 RepID=A0A165GKS6_9APHY|nr:drug:h+ antiporter [Laetiporus sulphureus 93-53]KZT10487.1 drug:h+ antiporter [Laetiporus sulphureus 93-53]
MTMENEKKQDEGSSPELSPKVTKEEYESETHPTTLVQKQAGIWKVEAAASVWGPISKTLLWCGIVLASYMYGLDNNTNWEWGTYATNEFGHANWYSAIQCAMAILLALGKPFFAKITDVIGRAEAYAVCLFFYCLGYIICASSQNMGTLGAGLVIYEIGFSGLQIAIQIVIADLTPLKYRGLVSAATSMPYFINFYAGSVIAAQVVSSPRLGWRWGYGIYCICFVFAIGPIIMVLFWAQHRAKKMNLVVRDAVAGDTFLRKAWNFAIEVDAVGMFFLGASITLIFLPLVLAGGTYATITWKNPMVPSMMVIGGVICIPVFTYWEIKHAAFPIVPFRLFANRTVFAVCIIGLFDFISFYLTWSYLYTFTYVVTDWSVTNMNYYSNCQSLCLTFFALLWGAVVAIFQGNIGYKWALFCSLGLRLIGVGIMFYARSHYNTAALVMTQIIQGAGGGIAAMSSQVGAQGAVPHQDMAVATAAILLFAEIGGVIGLAASGSMWNNVLPDKLEAQGLNSTIITEVIGSYTYARTYPDDIRDKLRIAYGDAMHEMLIPAIVLSVVPLLTALAVRNFKLNSRQNAVEAIDVSGKPVPDEEARD